LQAYAESAQKHFVELDQSSIGIRERLVTLETRRVEVEKRLNMPPGS
jgi:hypothetical protein